MAAINDLIESFQGGIPYADVSKHAISYMHEDSREAQDSLLMDHCLMNSVTDAAQKQVRTEVSHEETRATFPSVRILLSSLDQAMHKDDYNIELFNDNVIRGNLSEIYAGTIKWSIEDDGWGLLRIPISKFRLDRRIQIL